MRDQENVAKQP